MDINSINTSQMTPEIQVKYAAKLIKMEQQSDAVIASILEDTAEISQDAMKKYLSETKS